MFKSIDELRAQRSLIRKHLEWLDLQIQKAETNQEISQPEDAAEKSLVKPIDTDTEDQKSSEKKTLTHIATTSADASIEANFKQFSGGSDIKRAKIGCLAFFTVATLLFLFILFGLPYLLG